MRIIRSLYPPIDLFENIADPADWPLRTSAEPKTNPLLMERRAGGFGVLYAGNQFGSTLFETIHHHERFMARAREAADWARGCLTCAAAILISWTRSRLPVMPHAVAAAYRCGPPTPMLSSADRSSLQMRCLVLFRPRPESRQGRHLDYHWDGTRVDVGRDASGEMFRLVESN